jgi:hypothetical protein
LERKIQILENKINNNPKSEQEAKIDTDEKSNQIFEQVPFLTDFLNPKEKLPYNHYLAVAFSALDIRDNQYPFFWFNMQYGQHNNLFRVPGRFSFNLGYFGGKTMLGDRKTFGNINSFYLGAMYEFIFTFKYFYLSTGVGVYIRDDRDKKIGSNFVFGPKIAIGKSFNKFDIELIYQHFSNGYLADPNRGINLLALQVGFKF